MSIEAGVVIDNEGQALFWHEPQNRTGGSLPDSSTLWDVLWNNRDNISGFAHSHPGYGMPSPSYTDITTFAAVEAALGKRLLWPIISGDAIAVFEWCGPGKHDYQLIYSSRGVRVFTPSDPPTRTGSPDIATPLAPGPTTDHGGVPC